MLNNIKEIPERLKKIESLNGRIAFSHFSTPQNLPYAVYVFDKETDGADDYHNLRRVSATIELYQAKRDFVLEEEILKAFIDVAVTTYSDYIADEEMYMTEFNFDFVEKNLKGRY